MKIKNNLRECLKADKASCGTRIGFPWPYIIEAIGSSGNFDYVEFEAEYSPHTEYDLENMARAAELHGLGTMIKIDYQNRAYTAQKAIASGFQSILFTDHKTADQVRESISFISPVGPEGNGKFGFPYRRFSGFNPMVTQAEHVERLDEIVRVFMIENDEAVENLDEICAVPGVDMVQFGPYDYCLSKGWVYGEHQEEIMIAVKKMIETAQKHGVRPRVESFTGDMDEVDFYINLGIRDFAYGDQVFLYENFLNTAGLEMRKVVNSLENPKRSLQTESLRV